MEHPAVLFASGLYAAQASITYWRLRRWMPADIAETRSWIRGTPPWRLLAPALLPALPAIAEGTCLINGLLWPVELLTRPWDRYSAPSTPPQRSTRPSSPSSTWGTSTKPRTTPGRRQARCERGLKDRSWPAVGRHHHPDSSIQLIRALARRAAHPAVAQWPQRPPQTGQARPGHPSPAPRPSRSLDER
ncbi:MAG: hypothetical protein ACR2FU_06330 [Streptosporangiaceae bacterium]